MLDPIGDKLLLSGSFVVLAIDGAMEPWLALLVIGRDVVILLFAGGLLLFSKKKAEFPPSWWGKSSTVAQICYIIALIGHLGGFLPVVLPEIGKWCVLAFLAISGVDYARLRGGCCSHDQGLDQRSALRIKRRDLLAPVLD